MARILAVANQKGGVGKTTSAINLAASLAHLGQETLLIDMDPQANLSSGLGLTPEKITRHIHHVLLGETPLEETLRETSLEWLDVIPSHSDLYSAELELANLPQRESRLAQALSRFRKAYRYILIDCPPSLNLLTVNALVAAEAVLIPLPCEYYALEGLSMLIRTIQHVRGGLNPRLELAGVLLTMFDGRSNLARQVQSDIQKHFGDKVFQAVIPRNIRLAEAPSFGLPALLHDRECSGAQAYLNVARELLDRRPPLADLPAAEEVLVPVIA